MTTSHKNRWVKQNCYYTISQFKLNLWNINLHH